MTVHGCLSNPCPVCSGGTSSGGLATVMWNGPICPTCHARYVGSHVCSQADILRRIQKLLALLPGTQAPPAPPNPGMSWTPEDRTRNCPCRPENGGSGVCGCVLGGLTITCAVAS